jgi:hypothetical protein
MNRSILSLLLCFIAFQLTAQSLTQKVYEGTIMAKIPIILTLTQDGSALFGTVVYKKKGIPITVVGRTYESTLFLHELMNNGDVTGIYSMEVKGSELTGIWMAPKGNAKELKIALKEISKKTVPMKPLPDLTGTYAYSFGNEGGSGELLVQQSGTKFFIALSAVTGGPAYNQAFIDKTALTLKGNKAVYSTNEFGSCKVQFTFSQNAVRADYLNDAIDCGFGARASASGNYIRSSTGKPNFE